MMTSTVQWAPYPWFIPSFSVIPLAPFHLVFKEKASAPAASRTPPLPSRRALALPCSVSSLRSCLVPAHPLPDEPHDRIWCWWELPSSLKSSGLWDTASETRSPWPSSWPRCLCSSNGGDGHQGSSLGSPSTRCPPSPRSSQAPQGFEAHLSGDYLHTVPLIWTAGLIKQHRGVPQHPQNGVLPFGTYSFSCIQLSFQLPRPDMDLSWTPSLPPSSYHCSACRSFLWYVSWLWPSSPCSGLITLAWGGQHLPDGLKSHLCTISRVIFTSVLTAQSPDHLGGGI